MCAMLATSAAYHEGNDTANDLTIQQEFTAMLNDPTFRIPEENQEFAPPDIVHEIQGPPRPPRPPRLVYAQLAAPTRNTLMELPRGFPAIPQEELLGPRVRRPRRQPRQVTPELLEAHDLLNNVLWHPDTQVVVETPEASSGSALQGVPPQASASTNPDPRVTATRPWGFADQLRLDTRDASAGFMPNLDPNSSWRMGPHRPGTYQNPNLYMVPDIRAPTSHPSVYTRDTRMNIMRLLDAQSEEPDLRQQQASIPQSHESQVTYHPGAEWTHPGYGHRSEFGGGVEHRQNFQHYGTEPNSGPSSHQQGYWSTAATVPDEHSDFNPASQYQEAGPPTMMTREMNPPARPRQRPRKAPRIIGPEGFEGL